MGVLLKSLLSKVAPSELERWGIGIVIVFVAFLMYNHHERQIGAAKVEAAVQAEATKEAARRAQVESDAKIQIDGLREALLTASAAARNPAHVLCRSATIQSVTPSGNAGAGQGSNGPNGPAGGVAPSDAEPLQDGTASIDIAPTTEAILQRDGAVIKYLQGYIRVCQQKGICAPEKDHASP